MKLNVGGNGIIGGKININGEVIESKGGIKNPDMKNSNVNTEFLDYLLENDAVEIHLYIENFHIYPNEKKKWDVGPDSMFGAIPKAYKKNLDSKEIFEMVENIIHHKKFLKLADIMKREM